MPTQRIHLKMYSFSFLSLMFNRRFAPIIQVMEKINNNKALKVLIVDDVPSVRKDLRTLLILVGGLEVVEEAANGDEAVRY